MKHSSQKYERDKSAVVGIFKNKNAVENCFKQLLDKNFTHQDISILMAHDDHLKIDLNQIDTLHSEKTKETAIDAADRGLNSGMALGGVFGWLVGFEMFELPGIGFILATGPIGAALTGIAIGGTIGSIGGALLSLGISKLETKKIETAIKEKGIILSVHVDDPREQMVAKNILVSNGATKVFNPQKPVHQRGPSPFLFRKGMSH